MGTTPTSVEQVNRLGLPKADYKGSQSTLCPGCGHDAVTHHLQQAYWEMGIEPHRVVKLSGIGCSSKTTNYFINRGHGFNAVHGRMPSIATGAMLANGQLTAIGVSGDGDTASIGIGQFCHLIRRNVKMIYVIENNGVYGLTKGQFSATADLGSTQKSGVVNDMEPIDCCALAIELGCAFVARSFSGDGKQLMPLLKAAASHRGTALLDVISPCVTFNNHEGSTKSYDYVKEHDEKLHEIAYTPGYEVGFAPGHDPITADYEPGSTVEIALPDGSQLRLKKLSRDYDPTNKLLAMQTIEEARRSGALITGLLYIDPKKPDFNSLLGLVDRPLSLLGEAETRPPREALDEIMRSMM